MLRWLWTSRRLDAKLARLALLPAAGMWRAVTLARDAALTRRLAATGDPALPVVAVGNLTAGDSGKTAVLLWIARHLAAQGVRPAILARGGSAYRHRELGHGVPDALILDASRGPAAIEAAAGQGAGAVVLEGGLPPGPVRAGLTVAVIGAETSRAVRWPLPAGPWREGWKALVHADIVVVTRKRASSDAAEALAAELGAHTPGVVAIAHVGMRHLEGLVSGTEHGASALAGKRVVAASGSADPDAFVAQVKAAGAAVQVHTWSAEAELRDEDVAWLAHATRRADYVVITEQDAVKLRDRWPARVAEPLVAVLDLTWESNGDAVATGLDALIAPVNRV
jgi:tetraacyldisaccharide 4'-kinase